MFNYPPSIRQKITLGYYVIGAVIVILSIFIFLELGFMEKRIIFGEATSEFFNTTLDVRRFEKNYFLYARKSDYREHRASVTKAEKLLADNIEGFERISSAQHVTVLKESLQKYRNLMEQYANLNKQHIYGIEKTMLEEEIRKTGKEIVTIAEDISKAELKYLQAIFTGSRRVLIIVIVILFFLGTVVCQFLSRMVVRPLKLLENSLEIIADGGFERIHIQSKDREIVSLAHAVNKMLNELDLRQRHLVQSEKLASLGTLLSGVAHELNNPLSNISSSNQILKEELEDDDMEFKKELIHQISEQTDRARNIVRSLLEFSRDKDFKKQNLPLKTLFEETIRFVKGQIPKDVSVVVDIPDDVSITADKQRIQQVFLNLINNAVEAITGPGTLTIRAATHTLGGKPPIDESNVYNYLKYRGKCDIGTDSVDIEISDTGPGIPEEIATKIFDPFFTTKDVGWGSGLGLSIVHDIIDEHGGCIALNSEPGRGTTFLIRLPVK